MASLSITQHWADGSATTLDVETEDDYPDSLAEGLATVLRMWRETCQSGASE